MERKIKRFYLYFRKYKTKMKNEKLKITKTKADLCATGCAYNQSEPEAAHARFQARCPLVWRCNLELAGFFALLSVSPRETSAEVSWTRSQLTVSWMAAVTYLCTKCRIQEGGDRRGTSVRDLGSHRVCPAFHPVQRFIISHSAPLGAPWYGN